MPSVQGPGVVGDQDPARQARIELALDLIDATMREVYRERWSGITTVAGPDGREVRDPLGVWGRAIEGLTPSDLRRGLRRLELDSTREWPPTPAQFATACRQRMELRPVPRAPSRAMTEREREDVLARIGEAANRLRRKFGGAA